MRLRIAAAAAAGVVLIGFWAWSLAAPPEPQATVSLAVGQMSAGGVITVGALAFFAGLLAYFLAWPYGREIGVLAVPCGLAVWAGRCGSMAELIQSKAPLLGQQQTQIAATVAQRQSLFASLKWEPLFWLAIVAAGFGGVLLGHKVRSQPQPKNARKTAVFKSSGYLNAAIALVGSGLIAQFVIRTLAQDVEVGSFVAQPTTGQIAFAVLVGFGLAAFIVKAFLDASYIWPTIASALTTSVAVATYSRPSILEHVAKNLPAPFFSSAVLTILPIQMVAFGSLGSIAGYWLAVRYTYWRKHE